MFPPQGGGRSPRRVDPVVGRKAERPLGKVVVVVVIIVVVVVVTLHGHHDGDLQTLVYK